MGSRYEVGPALAATDDDHLEAAEAKTNSSLTAYVISLFVFFVPRRTGTLLVLANPLTSSSSTSGDTQVELVVDGKVVIGPRETVKTAIGESIAIPMLHVAQLGAAQIGVGTSVAVQFRAVTAGTSSVWGDLIVQELLA